MLQNSNSKNFLDFLLKYEVSYPDNLILLEYVTKFSPALF